MRGFCVLGLLLLSVCGISTALDCSQVAGALKQIDASNGQVFGVNSAGNIYTLYGSSWTQLPGALIHVTVGPAGVWGVNANNNIYRLVGGTWVQTSGMLKQIDAGGDQFMGGVNKNNNIYCLPKSQTVPANGNSQLSFVNIGGSLKYYSCGFRGCWGVNANNNIYFRKSVSPDNCGGSSFQKVNGALIMVEVGTEGDVYGVNSAGNIYRREGITDSNPAGTSWFQIENNLGKVSHVSYDLGFLWALSSGKIYKCKV